MIAETEFSVAGNTYRAGALNARTQFHVLRRLGSVAIALGAILVKDRSADPMLAMAPMVTAIGALPDADADYVITNCLSVVTRRQPGDTGWMQIQAGGALLFPDIDVGVMMQIVWKVLEANLASFFAALPSAMSEVAGSAVSSG